MSRFNLRLLQRITELADLPINFVVDKTRLLHKSCIGLLDVEQVYMVANSNSVFHTYPSDSFHCSSQTTEQTMKILKSICQSAEGEHLKITILRSTLVLFTVIS